MKKVFFQGAFDILNYGHIRAIEAAKQQGDYLIIGLNTDELIRDYKNREVILPYEHRKVILEAIKWVDKVVPAREVSPLDLLRRLDIYVYIIGTEWKGTKMKEIAYMKSKGGQVVFTPRYKGTICSSDIRRRIAKQALSLKGNSL